MESVKLVKDCDRTFFFNLGFFFFFSHFWNLKQQGAVEHLNMEQRKEDWSVERDIGISQEVLLYFFFNLMHKTFKKIITHISYSHHPASWDE